jgi:hypothetical protein
VLDCSGLEPAVRYLCYTPASLVVRYKVQGQCHLEIREQKWFSATGLMYIAVMSGGNLTSIFRHHCFTLSICLLLTPNVEMARSSEVSVEFYKIVILHLEK